MSPDQAANLRDYLKQDGWSVEQINYMRDGNTSDDELTVVTHQTIPGDGRYRFTDVIRSDGTIAHTTQVELKGN